MAITEPASTDLNYLSGDKFGFGVFVAAAAHAVIVFGLTFDRGNLPPPAPEIDVTIVTHQVDRPPEEADFIAQANQAASGTEERALVPTTNRISTFIGEDGGEFSAYEATAGASTSQADNSLAQEASEVPVPETEQVGDAVSDSELSLKKAALEARLDELQQEDAKRPRTLSITSLAARANEGAAYKVVLQERITLVGKSMLPAEQILEGATGRARLIIEILPDGKIDSIILDESSGVPFLDQTSVEIARSAGPFDPFPPELRAEYDLVSFIRTFEYSISGQLSIF